VERATGVEPATSSLGIEIYYGDGFKALPFTEAGRFGSGLAPAAQIRTIATYEEQSALTETLGIIWFFSLVLVMVCVGPESGFDSRPGHHIRGSQLKS
jgi:hypothetical protein